MSFLIINNNFEMAIAELGKGCRGKATINVFRIEHCPNSCPFRLGNELGFSCFTYKGKEAVVIVEGGETNETLDNFISVAPCVSSVFSPK